MAEQAPLSDSELVRSAKSNPADVALIFDRYWDPVFRYCYYRIGNWHDAEDAASQTFTNALTNLNRFQDDGRPESFRCWLFTIGRNNLINAINANSRWSTTSLETAAEVVSDSPGPEELAMDADRHRFAQSLLAQVTNDQREVLELRLAGLTSSEIATVLHRSTGSVRVIQHRAIENLRDQLRSADGETVEDSYV